MKTMRNEYRDLKKENDLIFSTLAEYDRDTITEIISVADNTRGIGYAIELIRKDLIAMAAQAEAQNGRLTDTIGEDVELFKHELLASMPKPKFADYMADSLIWLGFYSLAVSAMGLLFKGPWDCHCDVSWLALCIVIMMPSAWLLQRIMPAGWPITEKGVQYGMTVGATLLLWFVEFWMLYHWVTPLLPTVGLPNAVAVVLFGAATLALCIWRNRRRNQLAQEKPWREAMEK